MAVQKHESQVETSDAFEPGSPASDARLVESARLGEQSAFGELVRRYERRLLRVILRFVRDPDLAEDLAQEAFLRVYERLDQFDASRRFGPWLFRIGVNVTLDYLRRRKRRIWTSLFTDNGRDKWPDPPTADPRAQIDLHQEVWKVIEELPEKYRIVLVLRDLAPRGDDPLATGGSPQPISGDLGEATAEGNTGGHAGSGRNGPGIGQLSCSE
jgi:RNA polymerase sigma-70 factor (ECF subfamily)